MSRPESKESLGNKESRQSTAVHVNHSRKSIEEIFEALRGQPNSMSVSEDKLKNAPVERSKNAYFVPAQLQNIFNNLPKEQQEKYKWYGEEYYSRVIDSATHDVEMDAKKNFNALRSGLPFQSLSQDEQMVIKKFYGQNWYEKLGMTSEDG
jgi:hypothetical protein